MFIAFGVLLLLTTVIALLNERWIKLPATIGVTLGGAVAALLLVGAHALGFDFGLQAEIAGLLTKLDLTTFLLQGILSALLFAGAIELDAREMLRQKLPITVLAVGATIASTVLIGGAAWGVFQLVGLDLPLIWAMLFGALISPTDPVAVLDMLKRAKVPKKIETLISGEALFNDGVGVVVFLALAPLAGLHLGEGEVNGVGGAALLFLQQAGGGLLLGAVIGALTVWSLASVKGSGLEILITLTAVIAGYAAALALGVSGPIAMVVAGLVVSARKHAVMDARGEERAETFWSALDQVLNILLFGFIGLDVLLTPTAPGDILAGLLLIPVALAARFASVAFPIRTMRRYAGYAPWTSRLLTWGGLRGGIAISLCLGLPPGPYRSTIVTVTYAIVLFSIIVQGLTVMPVIRKATEAEEAMAAASGATGASAAAAESS